MPVRDAVAEDVGEICALIAEHAAHEGHDGAQPDPARMATQLFGERPAAWVLIAHPDGASDTVAGFAFCWWTLSTWVLRRGVWLDDLYVRPQFRRQGLAGQLMRELAARTDGRVEWEMQAGNTGGAAFYAELGAEVVPGWVQYRWYPHAP